MFSCRDFVGSTGGRVSPHNNYASSGRGDNVTYLHVRKHNVR